VISGRRRGIAVTSSDHDHQPVHDSAGYRVQALDEVTTTLELENGVPDVARFSTNAAGVH